MGKSSLLNRLFPGLNLKVGAVSSKTTKGSHTTTYAQMFQIRENGYVVDTPGIKSFGLWNVRPDNLNQHFPLINNFPHRCKHRDCHHVTEPGCSVKEASQKGELEKPVYDGYLALYESLKNNS